MIGARRNRRVYRKLVAASALVALTAGIGKGVSSALVPTETFAREGGIIVLCVGVIGVLIAYVVNRGDAVRGARQVYSGLMVLGVAMMLSTCFGFDIAYLSVGKESLWLVFSCFMAYLAFRYDFSPVRMFAIGQGVYFLASTAGWAVGSALAPYYGDSMVRMGTGIALAFMVIVVLVYVFPEIDLKRVMAWSVDSERGERAPGQARNGAAFAIGVCGRCRGCRLHRGGARNRSALRPVLARAGDPRPVRPKGAARTGSRTTSPSPRTPCAPTCAPSIRSSTCTPAKSCWMLLGE